MTNQGRPDTAKVTNVIVTGFGERRCNLVREGTITMFVKDEAKVSSRVKRVK